MESQELRPSDRPRRRLPFGPAHLPDGHIGDGRRQQSQSGELPPTTPHTPHEKPHVATPSPNGDRDRQPGVDGSVHRRADLTDSLDMVRQRDKELDEILGDLSGTRLYRNNVFRLTGLPATASATHIRRRREEAALMAKLGRPPETSGELPLTPAPGWDTVNAAFESIRNPILRLVHELLWLWGDGEDDDHDHAVRQHCGVLEGQLLTASGRPDMPNDLLGQQWLEAVQAWARVLSDEEIWGWARRRVQEINDPRLNAGTVRRLRDRLPRHIVDVHLVLAVKAAEEFGEEAANRHLWVLDESSFDDDLIDAALRDAVRPAEDRIRAACEAADRVGEAAPRDAVEAGHTLLEQTAAPLRTIAGMLGVDDPVTAATHDEVARSANLCAVIHEKETDTPRPALDLLSAARVLAREPTTIELIDRNMTVIGGALVMSKVDDLCKAGRVNAASDRLRAWRRHTEDQRLREQIDAVLADPTALRGPAHAPICGSWFGWGASLWGRRPTPEPGIYIATHHLTAFFIPVVPMAAYLRDESYIYGKVPLSMAARWWRLLVLALVCAVATQPFRDLVGLTFFFLTIGGITAVLRLRRYWLDRWVAKQVYGGERNK